jgi:hypothetical protein
MLKGKLKMSDKFKCEECDEEISEEDCGLCDDCFDAITEENKAETLQ